jgi:hypothetical protein
MAGILTEREQGFNDGLQAAIDYLTGRATAIANIGNDVSAQRTALLILVATYQADLRGLQKRSDAEMQAALGAVPKWNA